MMALRNVQPVAPGLSQRLLHSAIGAIAPEVNHGLIEGEGCGYAFGVRKGQVSELAKRIVPELPDVVAANGLRPSQTRLLLPTARGRPAVALVGLPDEPQTGAAADEQTRSLTGNAARLLRGAQAKHVRFEQYGAPHAIAEGAALGLYQFRDYFSAPTSDDEEPPTEVASIGLVGEGPEPKSEELFARGVVYAAAQNSARRLAEMPSNILTPKAFASLVQDESRSVRGVEAIVRDREWIDKQRMHSFLRVAVGSDEPPVFVELHYRGAPDATTAPLCLVGKGITFDSGGISIKPAGGMKQMKADMQGAACVASAVFGAARLSLPINVVGLIPLCENMPSGRSSKPGDVVISRKGLSIEIDNTDAEGRLILCDALDYAREFKPAAIVDLATLTGAMDVALGAGATGTFATSDPLWKALDDAGQATGDLLWRMPLLPIYREMMKGTISDLVNASEKRSAGACTAAAFLQAFIDRNQPWAHLDIAGVMHSGKTAGHNVSGMSGRPTRTLLEFLAAQANYRASTGSYMF